MKAKERIEQLERELAEVREELDLMERAETMERELNELKRRIAVRHPVFPQIWNGHRCTLCGLWVYPNNYHVCQTWHPTYISSSSGQITSGAQTSASINNVHPIMQKGLVSKEAMTNWAEQAFGHRHGDDPPDMGVVAAV